MKFNFFTHSLPTFNVLCLGERGTGKTVFLVGSYTEFLQYIEERKNKPSSSDHDVDLFFECQEIAERFLLNNILHYVTSQGVYPPPTIKITDFHFAFRQQKKNNELVHFAIFIGGICQENTVILIIPIIKKWWKNLTLFVYLLMPIV